MKKILITGASGIIGKKLCKLLSENYKITQLGRSKNNNNFESYVWNLEKEYIEKGALDNVDTIIHLAGAGIADKKWTAEQKKIIIKSRVNTADLLYKYISKLEKKPNNFISASAIGYYGAITTDKIFEESDQPHNDFLGKVCKKWEESSKQFKKLRMRTVQLRFGVVLSAEGGALKKMILPAKFGFGSALGTGKQYFPWIHIDDVINILKNSVEDKNISGAYNLVAPEFNNYNDFSRKLNNVLNRPNLAPNVPSFVLQLIFGEMSKMLLEGSRISSKKIISTGYKFKFENLENALKDLTSKNSITAN
ncbi:MAG: TIGR01777 family protein [Ignavibacteriae bacterium]|nr:MAG: TIGR01777 family protein [Ignavibacteriota bacterium]